MNARAQPRRGVFKNDTLAREAWGGAAYEAIPKSVFAYIAWHLANASSESSDAAGAAEQRFMFEWGALTAHGLQPPTGAARSLAKAGGGDLAWLDKIDAQRKCAKATGGAP